MIRCADGHCSTCPQAMWQARRVTQERLWGPGGVAGEVHRGLKAPPCGKLEGIRALGEGIRGGISEKAREGGWERNRMRQSERVHASKQGRNDK